MPYSKRTRRYLNSAYGSVFKARKAAGYRRKSRAKISRAGVGGATQTVSASAVPKLEVKTHDVAISTTTGVSDWQIISSNLVHTVTQGTGSSQRIGRKIKALGVVLRMDVTAINAQLFVLPYTIDLIWDTQPNGAVPSVLSIYGLGGGATRAALPNPNFNDRFIFLKRIEQTGFNQSSITTCINRTVNMSKEAYFDGTTGAIGDIEKGNLLVCACSVDPSVTYDGILRLMFHDM